ncbi:MAG: MBL fold metallo-hydrolase [Chloroflexi bacterium]|nr:MBL fold metallo-hydrolase [Chloroflexota bacterium]
MGSWREIADGVHVRRYRFYDQTIGAIVGRDSVAVIDTRTIPSQAVELRNDVQELSRLPITVVNTHGHYDHVFGNSTFRPCEIWGHARCVTMIERTGAEQLAAARESLPDLVDDLGAVLLDPPDRTFEDMTTVDLGERAIELRHLGRGHTDNDIVILVPDAGVLFAGDLLENGATPYFGDGYPLDWPVTARALRDLVIGPVCPGHGEPADVSFVERQLAEFEANATLARRVHAGEIDLDAAVDVSPYPSAAAREPLERALAQLRGELD